MADAANPAVVDAQTPGGFESFLNLEFGRQLGLMLGLAASVALGATLAINLFMEEDYKPLYSSLERIDGAAVVEVLDANAIGYRIDSRSGALLVASDQIHQARMQLAAAGMPGHNNVGLEILDQEQPLGTSQFMESARYRRGLEGELARTIASISSIRAARVHLAIPKSTVFLRDKREPRASVFVEPYGRGIDEQQVRAIANLVVSSVPELQLRNVTVVDQRGNLLSNFDDDPNYAMAARHLEYTREIEANLLERVNSLLEPIVGAQHFRAEVAADIDFTMREQTAEVYNPDLPAVRSEQTTSEQTLAGAGPGGVPGALTNQPPAGGAIEAGAEEGGEAAAAPNQSRVLETRNFELDRTISHTRHQLGQLRRLTVAVAVDDLLGGAGGEAEAAEGEEAAGGQAWDEDSLQRLATLVQNAVGYDASRGDRVTVINTPFMREEPEPIEVVEPPIWETELFWTALRYGLGVIGFLLLVFMVLRPTMKRLTENSKKIKELEAKHQAALNAVNEVSAGAARAVVADDGSVTLTAPDKNLLPSPEDQLDDQITMVRDMVNNDPERVAQVIQGWTSNE